MKKKVVIIGAGLGGMAAAITSAAHGAAVTIIEKNERVGGKCNILSTHGFTFDLGPSILILPGIFRMLFKEAGKKFDSYVKLVPVTLQWKNFFKNGTVINLFKDRQKTSDHFELLYPGSGKQFSSFYSYALKQFNTASKIFLDSGVDYVDQLFKPGNLISLFSLDLFNSMHRSVERYFKDELLRDIFSYFVKYVGSSSYRAPGFMNLLSGAQFHEGLWYIAGGIYNLASAMETLMTELGITIKLNTEVIRISTIDAHVNGVITGNGEKIEADAVISNMEVIPTCKRLLSVPDNIEKLSKKYEPSCSGIVLHLGLDTIYPQLEHHNFFYSSNQKKQFKTVFEDYQFPEDPTIYVVAPSRTDPAVVPPGCDSIKILPQVPHLRSDRLPSTDQYHQFCQNVLIKLETMGLTDLRKHIIVKDFWTPYDLERRYYSNEGSIYGVVTDRWKNFAFKAPKKSRAFSNLFFAGGSVNPGGGMPMVILSGLHAGRLAMQAMQGRTMHN